jgi:hypothetical protein
MKRTARILGLVSAVLAAGCSNTSLVPAGSTATFSGAFTGTASVVAVGATTAGGNGVQFTIGPLSSTAYPTFVFASSLSGTSLQTGTYTNSSSSVLLSETFVQQTSAAGPAWQQSSNAGVSSAGSFTLNISATGGSVTQNGTTVWNNATGSLNAVLAPAAATGASGTLNVSVQF